MISQKKIPTLLFSFLPLVVVITVLCGLVYAAVQQNYRQSANDPQIQVAEDVAAFISNGQEPTTLIPNSSDKVDIAKSLATYVIIYDDKGNIVASTGLLNGQIPMIPSGIFDYVRDHGEDRVTWQPQNGVRSAIVVTRFTGKTSGFVVVGRSLREVEERENKLMFQIMAAWVVAMVGSLVALLIPFSIKR